MTPKHRVTAAPVFLYPAPMETKDEKPCGNCGAATTLRVGDEAICENCWHEAGACCGGE
ncbi:MAG: hypothetical protein ABIT37_07140 [Luteolibacter sp.]